MLYRHHLEVRGLEMPLGGISIGLESEVNK